MLDVTRKLVELLDIAPVGDDHFQGESEDLGFPMYLVVRCWARP